MGGYQLSLQAGSYNPAARGSGGSTGSADSGSWNGSSRGKKAKRSDEMLGFGKRVASQQHLEGLMQASPPRHSTACCDGLSLQLREMERRLSSKVRVPVDSSESNYTGHSFRSDDSDNLALWEEKETSTATTDQQHAWVKLTATQSPRWLDAMRRFDATKLAPWRSSPVHPRLGDTPHASLDRKPSTRSLHVSTKAWYNKKLLRNGESRSVRSTPTVKLMTRRSGELNPAVVTNSSKWDHESDEGSKHESFSRMMEEDTRVTASAVAWDISPRPEPVAQKARPVHDLSWEIPAVAAVEAAGDHAYPLVTTDHTDPNAPEEDLSQGVKVQYGEDSPPSEDFFDAHSEYASCRTFIVDENDSRFCEDTKSTNGEFVNMIDFVAPLLTKLQLIEKKEDWPTKSSEGRVSFKWEAPAGKQLRAEEVALTTETLQPPPCATHDGSSTPYETLRQQYIMRSKSAPLDGLYVFLPQSGNPLPWVKKSSSTAPDSVLTKSKSYNGEGSMRRLNSSPDHRLFTKLRNSVYASPAPLRIKNDLGEYIESSSPRSILRGPDDGSVPSSSNPSLRSDPGTRPTSASQSMSSCSASFDLNEGDYEMIRSSCNLNSTAACVIVESRRVSLSFRDFGGPAQPSGAEDVIVASENASPSNVELLGCDGRLDTSALRCLSETMQSPELWTGTFSARRHEACDSPQRPDMPQSPTAATERESEFAASKLLSSPPPARRLAYLMSCEDEQEQRSIAMQKSRSRNGEFTARLGVILSPLRLISSHESSHHGCFVATTLSPPHEEGGDRSPTFAATLELLSPVELHSSSVKTRKSKGLWNNVEMVKSRSSKRRHSSDDSQTMMVTLSKAMKRILSKCTVKRSTSKGKSKTNPPAPDALLPPEFHFT